MEASKIIQEYEELFGELPHLPIMGNYGSILSEMHEAIIRKKPLTDDEVIELFADIPVDQGTEIVSEK